MTPLQASVKRKFTTENDIDTSLLIKKMKHLHIQKRKLSPSTNEITNAPPTKKQRCDTKTEPDLENRSPCYSPVLSRTTGWASGDEDDDDVHIHIHKIQEQLCMFDIHGTTRCKTTPSYIS